MRGMIGVVVILGLLLVVGMILAGLRSANALLKRTQAAQAEAMDKHRAGLAQIEEGMVLQREAVELARRATAAAEQTARVVTEIRTLLAEQRGPPEPRPDARPE